MDWLPVLKLAVAFVILVLASREDWRTREASDVYWVVLGTLGIVLIAFQIVDDEVDPLYLIFLVPLSVLFYDIFWDRKGFFEDGINFKAIVAYSAAIVSIVVLLIAFQTSSYLWQLLTVPIMILIFILFYQFDIIKGGADAKALISLAILFPAYPIIGPFPLIALPPDPVQFIFPFALAVLFNAALIMLVLPVSFLVLNLARRDIKFPAMLFGYKMRIEDARHKFVWPMERLESGQKRLVLLPKDDDSDDQVIDELEQLGERRIWVTPKVPFLIPITISLILSALVGNLLFLFFIR